MHLYLFKVMSNGPMMEYFFFAKKQQLQRITSVLVGLQNIYFYSIHMLVKYFKF